MSRLRHVLLALTLGACNPGDRSETGDASTTGDDSTTAPTDGTDSTGGDDSTDGTGPADEIGGCENFLPPIVPAEAPPGQLGEPYELTFSFEGGDQSGIDWSIQTEELPPGLTFDPDTATLAGTPTLAGYYVFWIEAAVADGDGECPTAPTNRFIPLMING